MLASISGTNLQKKRDGSDAQGTLSDRTITPPPPPPEPPAKKNASLIIAASVIAALLAALTLLAVLVRRWKQKPLFERRVVRERIVLNPMSHADNPVDVR